MKVLVDTSVWSLALRRGKQSIAAQAQELRQLIQDHRVHVIGPIRQEILSGIRSESQFNKLKKHLESFPTSRFSLMTMLEPQKFSICVVPKEYRAQTRIF